MNLRRVESGSPERLSFAQTPGNTGVGVGMSLSILGYFAFGLPTTGAPLWLPSAIGFGLITIGVASLGFRRGLTVDRQTSVFTTWAGLFFPMRYKTRSLDVKRVRLSRTQFRHRGVTHTIYMLDMDLDRQRVHVGSGDDALLMWNLGQELASFIGVELYDLTDPSSVQRTLHAAAATQASPVTVGIK